MFSERKYVEVTDFSVMEQWWLCWGKHAPKKQWLPKIGVVVSWDEEPVAISFLYASEIGLGQIGFTVTNPDVGLKKRVGGIVRAMNYLEQKAKELELPAIHSLADESTLIRIMAARGYKVLSLHQCLIKDLGE